jgi:hypothetical protein
MWRHEDDATPATKVLWYRRTGRGQAEKRDAHPGLALSSQGAQGRATSHADRHTPTHHTAGHHPGSGAGSEEE